MPGPVLSSGNENLPLDQEAPPRSHHVCVAVALRKVLPKLELATDQLLKSLGHPRESEDYLKELELQRQIYKVPLGARRRMTDWSSPDSPGVCGKTKAMASVPRAPCY